MATYTVTNSYDAGSGSLREAIAQANANPGADTIVFAPALAGETIALTSTELTITDGLVIDGDIDDDGTPDITVDANADGDAATQLGPGASSFSARRVVTVAGPARSSTVSSSPAAPPPM